MKSYLIVVSLCLLLSCKSNDTDTFQKMIAQFAITYAQVFPDDSPLNADNAQLKHLAIATENWYNANTKMYKQYSAEIQNFSIQSLSPTLQKDAKIMRQLLDKSKVFEKEYASNPQLYNVKKGFERILAAHFSTEKKIEILNEKINDVPAFYVAAKNILTKSDENIVDLTLEQQAQTLDFFDITLTDFLNDAGKMTPEWQQKIEAATLSVRDYMAYIQSFKLK